MSQIQTEYSNGCSRIEIENDVRKFLSIPVDGSNGSLESIRRARSDLDDLSIIVERQLSGVVAWAVLPHLADDLRAIFLSWVRRDMWNAKEAALILSDVWPGTERFVTDQYGYIELTGCATFTYKYNQRGYQFDDRQLPSSPVGGLLGRIQNSFEEKMHLLGGLDDNDALSMRTPEQWVSWAVEKRFKVNWIEHAFVRGFMSQIKQKIEADAILRELYLQPRVLLSMIGDSCTEKSTHAPSASRDVEVDIPYTAADLPVRAHINGYEASARVWWRKILEENLSMIDSTYGGRADVTQVLQWLKKHGGDRILSTGGNEELVWIDDANSRLTVAKKTVSNALSALRQ